MLPDRCSVMKEGKQCVNPPEFIVSIIDDKDEYMVGVTCGRHKQVVSGKELLHPTEANSHPGKSKLSLDNTVGTARAHGDADDFIQIDVK